MTRKKASLLLLAALATPLCAQASLFGSVNNIFNNTSSSLFSSSRNNTTSNTLSPSLFPSTSTGLTCSTTSVTPLIIMCSSLWTSMNTSIASSTVPTTSISVADIAVCYDRNLCGCISALSTKISTISASAAQSCNMAVGNAYFAQIQAAKVKTAKAAASAASAGSFFESLIEAAA